MTDTNPTKESSQRKPTTLSLSTEDRFWAKVDKTPGQGPQGDCWLWTAKRDRRAGYGYGQFQFEARTQSAHRVAYMLAVGPIPQGLCVLHRCDVRMCVRPDHLWLGTQADNQLDMALKGRSTRGSKKKPGETACGERNGNSKLSTEDVRVIRHSYQPPVITQKILAARFHVSDVLISQIVKGRIWRHLLPTLVIMCLMAVTSKAQSVISPFRSDGLVSPGASAVVIDVPTGVESYESSATFLPLASELAGVTIQIDGHSCGLWIIFPNSIHFVVPDDLPIIPRQPIRQVTITTPLGTWNTTLTVARAAPGLVTDGKGGPAGYFILYGGQFYSLSASGGVIVQRHGSGSMLAVWSTGIRGARRPLPRFSHPLEPWFQADCWLWIGGRRIEAMWHETGIPGLDYVCAYLPLDLPAGKYELRVEAGRVKSEPLPLVVW